MRPVFYKFLKFRKKQKTPLPEKSTPVIWPRYDLQLNYSIGKNFNIHPPTFSMDGFFPFYCAPGSLLTQNFRHVDPTLAGSILDQAEPNGILLNRFDSPACVVSESDSPTSSRSGWRSGRKRKKAIRQIAARRAKGSSNEYQTMIRLNEGWSTCKAQHEFRVPHNTPQKWNLNSCVYFYLFMHFGSATQKLSHFSALQVTVSTFRKFFGCLIFGLGCSATWVLVNV